MNYVAVLAILLFASTATLHAEPLEGGVDPARVAQIAAILPDGTFTFAPKITDRAAWAKLAANPAYAKVIANAEKKLTEPVPPLTAEIYAEYKTTGQRTKHYADVRGARHNRIALYTIAEGLENKGRFIKPLEEIIADVCTEPAWTFNFHDTANLDYWNGKQTVVDLGAILPAHDMADALVVFGDKLDQPTRNLIIQNCRRRILDPYRHAVENEKTPGFWWVSAQMNWNAVCHNGVVGTALGVCDDKTERAWFIAAAEKYSADYLKGFGPDGYCAEGMGYWNYGFSNFIFTCELIWRETNGKVDLYDLPNARAAAMYPAHIAIINGLTPAYADSGLNPKPEPKLASFINRRYRLGVKAWDMPDISTAGGSISNAMFFSTPSSADAIPPTDTTAGYELRSYFDHGGVLTCRPAQDSSCRLGVSLKGGNNAEPHNHDDLGTFVVAVGTELLILDPGGEVYNARTFSKDRYKSNLLNSFGHPVPTVAGKLQREGLDAAAKIVTADFTDAADTFAMDISSAYKVPQLTKLTRIFVYTRTGDGSLTVTDDFAFTSPELFGGALITYGQWKQQGDNTVILTQGKESAEVTIDTAGQPFELKPDTINEHTHDGKLPTRIGINLKNPTASGKVVLTIRPLPPAATTQPAAQPQKLGERSSPNAGG